MKKIVTPMMVRTMKIKPEEKKNDSYLNNLKT